MERHHLRAAVLASLVALLATAVLAAPAAGAVGSVSTDSQVATETTTHQFTVDAAGSGPLEAVELDYRSDADLDGASVTVGVDRDGDGDVDDRVPTRVTRGDGGLVAVVGQPVNVTATDSVVVEVRGVTNPSTVGTHAAAVGATVDGTTDTSEVTYRVTPFRSDDTAFRGVEIPGSSFDRTYATGSTVADVRLVGADWRGVTFEDAVLEDVTGVDDAWTGVAFADATATTLRTERTEFDSVTFSDAALSDVRSTDDSWRAVSATDAELRAVDSSGSTYRDVRFSDARVTGLSVDSSTLEGVAVRPAAPETDAAGNVSEVNAGASGENGTASASVRTDVPSPDATDVDAVLADARGTGHAANGTVANVSLRDATLRNVTVEDGALVDVRVESATLRNVTLENVTLRGVTLSEGTYADGTLSDAVITSEAELEAELLVDEADGTVPEDAAASASTNPSEGEANVDDGGALEDGSDESDEDDDLLGN